MKNIFEAYLAIYKNGMYEDSSTLYLPQCTNQKHKIFKYCIHLIVKLNIY